MCQYINIDSHVYFHFAILVTYQKLSAVIDSDCFFFVVRYIQHIQVEIIYTSIVLQGIDANSGPMAPGQWKFPKTASGQ